MPNMPKNDLLNTAERQFLNEQIRHFLVVNQALGNFRGFLMRYIQELFDSHCQPLRSGKNKVWSRKGYEKDANFWFCVGSRSSIKRLTSIVLGFSYSDCWLKGQPFVYMELGFSSPTIADEFFNAIEDFCPTEERETHLVDRAYKFGKEFMVTIYMAEEYMTGGHADAADSDPENLVGDVKRLVEIAQKDLAAFEKYRKKHEDD
jgi:hypothetical protein